MSEQSYKVGQVIYVVLHKERKIFPMLIVEEVTKKTLNGIVVNHVAQVGQSTDRIVVSEIQGSVYHTPTTARDSLTAAATRNIQKQIDAAILKAAEWYPDAVTPVAALSSSEDDFPHVPDINPDDIGEEPMMVELPDGRMARLRTK